MFKCIFIIIVMLFTIYLKTQKSLHMLQQNLYNENNRYLKWVYRNANQFINMEIVAIFIALLGLFVIYDLEGISLLAFFTICLVYVYCFYRLRRIKANTKTKKPLVVTKRVKRLITTISLIYLIFFILLLINYNNVNDLWLYILVLTLLIYLNTIVVYIANIINKPIERMVYKHYERLAKNKLKSMTNLKIIGITGSYGKTSSKNILSDILNVKYDAFASPKNLNTFLGLMSTINNNLDKFTEIFIAEMGAYVKGEIHGLCELVNPKYGILTKIGTAHLETFGSEENIVEGKFELIEYLPKDGVGVLNKDDPKQVSYKLKNTCKIIWIGIDNEDCDVRAIDIKCSNVGTTFKVKFKDDDKLYKFTTKLLGKHNVYNILASIALGKEFNIEIADLISSVALVKPVEHRLELKRLGNFYQIDDAYNSNPVGAKNALDVLEMMPGIKVVVTPGMIELGKKEEYYNEEFGKQIASVADYVVLIGKKRTLPILEGLKQKGYDKDRIIVYNDVRDAYSFISNLKEKKEVYALFENDLPDSYDE